MIRLLLALILVAVSCNRENLSDRELFLNNFFSSQKLEGKKIVYADELSDETISQLQTFLNKDTIKELGNSSYLVLAESEKKEIVDNLEMQKTFKWSDKLISNSQLVLKDTVTSILHDKKRGWDYFKSNYPGFYYSFSNPIFFRDNSLCAFYYHHGCGSECAEGEFVIYKKNGRNWKRLVGIYGWIS
jgi:hypothetical protein